MVIGMAMIRLGGELWAYSIAYGKAIGELAGSCLGLSVKR